MTSIYLDHAATTPMHQEVIEEMTRIMSTIYGNPSSVHQFGRSAHFELEMAREVIAKQVNASPEEIIFNSGGTEGDNTIIIETALHQAEKGKHLITTNVEHSAVSKSLEYLEDRGFEVTYLPVNEDGFVTVKQVSDALREDTILVTMMYGNNETGNLFPIREVGELLETHQTYFHTDAVQAFGTEMMNVKELKVDYLSVSAHKINGPKGVGFAYYKKGCPVPVLLRGGSQEEKKRAGTENLAGIVGLAKAVSLLTDDQKQQNKEKYHQFKTIIITELKNAGIEFCTNGDADTSLTHILNIWIKGVPSNILLSRLDLLGFAVSAGSACSAGNVKPSPVILKMKKDFPEAASQSIRISFGYGLEDADIRAFCTALIKSCHQQKNN